MMWGGVAAGWEEECGALLSAAVEAGDTCGLWVGGAWSVPACKAVACAASVADSVRGV